MRENARLAQWLAQWVALLLAAGLLLIFGLVVVSLVRSANQPPLLADPAPVTVPVSTGGSYPPQLRGGFDPNARLLSLLAVVSPLLTTVVGFYFGQRAGAAAQAAAEAENAEQKATVSSIVQRHAQSGMPAAAAAKSLLEELQQRGLVP
jgi:hypothetical protein